ncbi:MAG: phage tail tube protein [Thermodesulfobacteriota bacterium]
MANRRLFLEIGEEANRGAAESSTIGGVPMLNPGLPKMEFDDKFRADFRGEDPQLGPKSAQRMSQKWAGSFEIPFYTESGGAANGLIGTIIKHFFGDVTSAQNAATGQYYHMMYPVTDPFGTAALGSKALTMNINIHDGTTLELWPFVGGRVKSLSFDQEPGGQLKMSLEMFGQKLGTIGAGNSSPAEPAENLRCDYNNLKVYTGTITRVGTAPNFTDFTFVSATQFSPDKISVKIEDGKEDKLRLAGLDYPDKTRQGRFRVTLEMTIDFEDPASGFSSADELRAWLAAASATNFFLHWDTGAAAGTGDNHSLYIDLPAMQRMGGEPEYSRDGDPTVTLKYEGLYSATTAYMIGVMLKNTATAV